MFTLSDCITPLHSNIEITSLEVQIAKSKKYSSIFRSNTLYSEIFKGVCLFIDLIVVISLNASSN